MLIRTYKLMAYTLMRNLLRRPKKEDIQKQKLSILVMMMSLRKLFTFTFLEDFSYAFVLKFCEPLGNFPYSLAHKFYEVPNMYLFEISVRSFHEYLK